MRVLIYNGDDFSGTFDEQQTIHFSEDPDIDGYSYVVRFIYSDVNWRAVRDATRMIIKSGTFSKPVISPPIDVVSVSVNTEASIVILGHMSHKVYNDWASKNI